MISQFLLEHSKLIYTVLSIDVALGLALMLVGIIRWRHTGRGLDMWTTIDWFISVDIPDFWITLFVSDSEEYLFRDFVLMILVNMFTYLPFCWILGICRIGRIVSVNCWPLGKFVAGRDGYIHF